MTHPVKLVMVSLIGLGLVAAPVSALSAPPARDKDTMKEHAKEHMKDHAKSEKMDKEKSEMKGDPEKMKALHEMKERQHKEWQAMMEAQMAARKNPGMSDKEMSALKKKQAEERKAMKKRHKEEMKMLKGKDEKGEKGEKRKGKDDDDD